MENTELLQQVTAKAEKWLNGAYNEEAKAEVRRMLNAEDKTELIEKTNKNTKTLFYKMK